MITVQLLYVLAIKTWISLCVQAVRLWLFFATCRINELTYQTSDDAEKALIRLIICTSFPGPKLFTYELGLFSQDSAQMLCVLIRNIKVHHSLFITLLLGVHGINRVSVLYTVKPVLVVTY